MLFILTDSIVFVQCIPVLVIKTNGQELSLKNKSLDASFNDLESTRFKESVMHYFPFFLFFFSLK